MKVFDSIQDEGFEFLHPAPPDDWDSLELRFNRYVAGTEWTPRPLRLIREDEGKKRNRGDWLYLSHHVPVLRPAAGARAGSPPDQISV